MSAGLRIEMEHRCSVRVIGRAKVRLHAHVGSGWLWPFMSVFCHIFI